MTMEYTTEARCNLIGYTTKTQRNINAYNEKSTGLIYVNGYSCVFGCLYPLNQIEFRKTILLILIAFATKNNFITNAIKHIL